MIGMGGKKKEEMCSICFTSHECLPPLDFSISRSPAATSPTSSPTALSLTLSVPGNIGHLIPS